MGLAIQGKERTTASGTFGLTSDSVRNQGNRQNRQNRQIGNTCKNHTKRTTAKTAKLEPPKPEHPKTQRALFPRVTLRTRRPRISARSPCTYSASPRGDPDGPMGPRRPQDRPKTAPRRLRERPQGTLDRQNFWRSSVSPRGDQDGPMGPKTAPRSPQDGSKTPPDT